MIYAVFYSCLSIKLGAIDFNTISLVSLSVKSKCTYFYLFGPFLFKDFWLVTSQEDVYI